MVVGVWCISPVLYYYLYLLSGFGLPTLMVEENTDMHIFLAHLILVAFEAKRENSGHPGLIRYVPHDSKAMYL